MTEDYIELDDNWINEFKNDDKLYQEFYSENVYYINIKFIYVDSNNNIQKIIHERYFLEKSNIISKDEIVSIIKSKCINDNIRYKLLSILKYNFNLSPDKVSHFLKSTTDGEYFNFLKTIKHIEDIYFEKTINMFHELNDLFIVFYEKNVYERNKNNTTKKIILNLSHKKTLRK